jgi:two-component system OmpR family response regulator
MKGMNGIKLMLVDDEPHILQFLELGLVNEGFEVKTAPEGMSAVTLAREYEPHVVVLDVMMPGMDGFEVCKLLKQESDNIAVIMLTAKDEVEDRVKGLTLGADDYLIKPFSFDELLARIGARLRNQFPSLTGDALGAFRIDDRRKEIVYQQQVL